MTQALIQTKAYRQLITELKSKVQSAQIKAALKVNEELITLYWDIGQMITERQQSSDWGDNVIGQIANDLTHELGGIKGFSERNLYRMKLFFTFYAVQQGFSPQLVAKIPWGHNALIIQKIKDPQQALWYVQKTLDNGWSRNVLALQIESQLYERQVTAPKIDNFTGKLPTPDTDLFRESLKDPYVFDFLSVGDKAHERDIETALVENITRFLLELGKGFAFVGKQYRLGVGTEEFFIDLLMYNLNLHRYIVIEIKNRGFKPADTGQLNFYLTAIDRQIKTDRDDPTIGLLLCKTKDNLVAEYALQGMEKPMGVTEFQLTKALPDELKTSLPTIEEMQAELTNNEPQDD